MSKEYDKIIKELKEEFSVYTPVYFEEDPALSKARLCSNIQKYLEGNGINTTVTFHEDTVCIHAEDEQSRIRLKEAQNVFRSDDL